MLPVQTILAKLEEGDAWPDGESVADIRKRLTSEQLEAPGKLVLRVTEYKQRPFLLSGRIFLDATLLCEVKHRITELTREDVSALLTDWQERGYLEAVNVSYR